MHLLIYSFIEYLMSTYYVSSTFIGIEDIAMNKWEKNKLSIKARDKKYLSNK